VRVCSGSGLLTWIPGSQTKVHERPILFDRGKQPQERRVDSGTPSTNRDVPGPKRNNWASAGLSSPCRHLSLVLKTLLRNPYPPIPAIRRSQGRLNREPFDRNVSLRASPPTKRIEDRILSVARPRMLIPSVDDQRIPGVGWFAIECVITDRHTPTTDRRETACPHYS
jgi:hypothetical protein